LKIERITLITAPITTNQPTPSSQNNSSEALYGQDITFSTGNKGVPTDKQTNRQTNSQEAVYLGNDQKKAQNGISDFQKASEILENLDNIKKEIRLKFKRLTNQEMLVFSTIYGLEEQKTPEINHKILAKKLNLSESSVRDYINKLINKGIPIDKVRQNNKKILLRVSSDLRSIAPLSTILMLREL